MACGTVLNIVVAQEGEAGGEGAKLSRHCLDSTGLAKSSPRTAKTLSDSAPKVPTTPNGLHTPADVSKCIAGKGWALLPCNHTCGAQVSVAKSVMSPAQLTSGRCSNCALASVAALYKNPAHCAATALGSWTAHSSALPELTALVPLTKLGVPLSPTLPTPRLALLSTNSC